VLYPPSPGGQRVNQPLHAVLKPSHALRARVDENYLISFSFLPLQNQSHIQEVSDLLDHFRFLPNWRLDDVMVSYATEGGGVGPHVDSFDVFLLQAQGRRSWKTSYTPIIPEDENLISDCVGPSFNTSTSFVRVFSISKLIG